MNDFKWSKENVYKALQSPSREDLIESIFNGVGEQDDLDFKENWAKEQKIAEIILGMANIGGGSIIVGVKENDEGTLEANGLSELIDKEKLHSKICKFLPDNVMFDIFDYNFKDESYDKIKGKLFQILVVYSEDKELPYIWRKNTDSAEEGCIFCRKGTKTVKANMQEINDMIDRKIEAVYTEKSSLELEEHLKQLNTLYKNLSSKTYLFSSFDKLFNNYGSVTISGIKNSIYPEESYEEFVVKMIDKKKEKIEKILDLT
ncbi:RNA-binding domain-containing protein [uncultured Thomasclavelia sp.]|uniref:AlbA family DNA-binding domain-containing protein n=1 Tax=uncultured Thomasclavelia sp. TaxID=3025759 RepID=UPI00280AB472|nr:RNA-binding domain-containing protein [uncultured Thomasclavelia sp.]